MTKLSFQDSLFLRAESSTSPMHVAALMVFVRPDEAGDKYMRQLVAKLGRLNKSWPIFNRKLKDPGSTNNASWILAEDFDPADHVFHYSLPGPGRMNDLLRLVAHAHERLLDRNRPLWQIHLIDGLNGGRFAVYFKVHHALIDGVGGLRMIQQIFATDPSQRTLGAATEPEPDKRHGRASVARALGNSISMLQKQSKAVPEVLSMLSKLGWKSLLGSKDSALPPFAAPHTILNNEVDARRRIIVSELPLKRLKAIGRHYKGTINDVVVAICGGALRQYLSNQGELPRRSLDAGVPVSVKGNRDGAGNQLSFIICPFATDEADPARRLRRVIRATRKAKTDLSHMSPAATEDIGTIVMFPFLVLSMTHTSQNFPPVFNTIVSNVPGPKRPLYLDGSRLERIYPMSVITDGLGLNITVISYGSRLCIAVTSCPSDQPGIESLGPMIKKGYKELLDTMD